MDLSYDVWTPLGDGNCVLGCNTDHIPPIIPINEPALPRIDGTWGPHDYTIMPQRFDPEAPYLAWCPRRPHPAQPFKDNPIMAFRLAREDYVQHHQQPRLGGLRKSILATFQQEVLRLTEMYVNAAQIAATHWPSVIPPSMALERMRQSLIYLNLPDIYFRDCQEAVETLRRNTREVQGFVLWARTPPSGPYPAIPFQVRGSVAIDEQSYEYLSLHKVPGWYVTGSAGPLGQTPPIPITRKEDMCTLQTMREVDTKDSTMVDWDEPSPGIFQLLHTKELWYYPPVVGNRDAFEAAARGYGPRNDELREDKRVGAEIRKLRRAGESNGIGIPA